MPKLAHQLAMRAREALALNHEEALDIAMGPQGSRPPPPVRCYGGQGAPLQTRMEGQIAISALLQRVPSLHLDVDSGSLRWRRGIFLRGLQRLPLVFE